VISIADRYPSFWEESPSSTHSVSVRFCIGELGAVWKDTGEHGGEARGLFMLGRDVTRHCD
jgi:hypothetical protein